MTLKLLTSRYCYNMIDTSFSILVVPGAVPRYDIILISTILHCKRYNTVQLQMKIYCLKIRVFSFMQPAVGKDYSFLMCDYIL